MRLARPLILSAAALAIAGAAYAERPATHVASYQLPDGNVLHVRYTGDVAPRLVVVGDPIAATAATPFAAFDRIAAMMDAQADAMFAQAVRAEQIAVATPSGRGTSVSPAAPAGARWTSVSRTVSDGRVCTTEVSTVFRGDVQAPTTLCKVSGDCAAAAPTAPTPPTPPVPPRTVPRDSI